LLFSIYVEERGQIANTDMNGYTILEEDMLRYVQKKFSNRGARPEDLEKMGEREILFCINKIFGNWYKFPRKNVEWIY
jgi:hypothetical protein